MFWIIRATCWTIRLLPLKETIIGLASADVHRLWNGTFLCLKIAVRSRWAICNGFQVHHPELQSFARYCLFVMRSGKVALEFPLQALDVLHLLRAMMRRRCVENCLGTLRAAGFYGNLSEPFCDPQNGLLHGTILRDANCKTLSLYPADLFLNRPS